MGIITTDLIDDAATIDDKYVRTYQRVYRIRATTDFDSYAVRGALGIIPNTVHPSDSRATVNKISVGLDHAYQGNDSTGVACYVWRVSVDYGLWNPLEHSATGDPLVMPLKYRLQSVNTPEIVYEDVDGNPIVNSAGDYYDPPIERDSPRWTLSITRNEATPSLSTIGEYANRINESTWNGFPSKTVKITPLTLSEREYSQYSGTLYYPLEYIFEINFNGWTKQVLNQGYRQLDGSGKLQNIYLDDGQPASSPVNLDESGHAILTPAYTDSSGGAAPDEPSGTTEDTGGTGSGTGTGTAVVVNAYEIYRPMDFSVLDTGFSTPLLLSGIF